jgi:hypothetical protein
MKTLTVPIPDWNHTLHRVVVLCLAIAGLGLATWYGMQPRPADNGGSFVEGQPTPPPNGYPNGYNEQIQPIVYRDRTTSEGQCSQWDVSPLAMEAILQEMLRRGWKPPTQGEAIASIAPMGSQMVAVDPNAPLPVFTRPASPPVETATPEGGVVSDDPDPTVTAPVPTTRPPAALPSRPPAAQPPAATPPRTAPPVAAAPRPPSTQPPATPRPATPPAAAPPAAAPATPPVAPPAEPADPT